MLGLAPLSSVPLSSLETGGIAFDAAGNSGVQTADNDYTFDVTVGTGENRFIGIDVEVLGTPGTTVTAVTYDNAGTPVAMALIGTASTISGMGIVESWKLVAPASGTKQVRVQLSGAVNSAATWVSYSNVHQTTPEANFASETGSGPTDATVTITIGATGSWAKFALASTDTDVTSSQTARNEVTDGASGVGANSDTGGIVAVGTTDGTYTDLSALTVWVISGYELRPDTASSGDISTEPSPVSAVSSVVAPSIAATITPSAITSASSSDPVIAIALSTSISPVTAAAGVVGPSVLLSTPTSPVTVAGSVIDPTTALALVSSPATAVGGIADPAIILDTLTQAVSLAISGIGVPTVQLAVDILPVTTVGSIITPALATVPDIAPVTVISDIVSPSLGVSIGVDPTMAGGTVAAPTLAMTAPILSVAGVGSVPLAVVDVGYTLTTAPVIGAAGISALVTALALSAGAVGIAALVPAVITTVGVTGEGQICNLDAFSGRDVDLNAFNSLDIGLDAFNGRDTDLDAFNTVGA